MSITIGPNCLHGIEPSVIERALNCAGPAWFDGSFLYRLSGKYELVGTTWIKKHDLSRDGLFRWFEPCDYVAYNADAGAEYEVRKAKQEAAEAAEAQRQQAQREAAEARHQRYNSLSESLQNWISSCSDKWKKGSFFIRLNVTDDADLMDTVVGMTCGLFGVYFNGQDYSVTHLKSGKRLASFERQVDAKRFATAAEKLADWSTLTGTKSNNRLNKDLGVACRILEGFCKLNELPVEDLETLWAYVEKKFSTENLTS